MQRPQRPLQQSSLDPSTLTRQICNYPSQKRKLYDFITRFGDKVDLRKTAGHQSDSSDHSLETGKYIRAVKQLSEGARTIEFAVDDILQFFGHGNGPYAYKASDSDKAADVINTLICNTQRSLVLLCEVIEELRREKFPQSLPNALELDALMEHKIAAALTLPIVFRVPYEILLTPPSYMQSTPIHELRAKHVGGLTKVDGLVSKISTVKPCLTVAVYHCEECGNHEFQQVDSAYFTPNRNCNSASCKSARRADTLMMSLRDSRFLKRQEAKVQELAHLVPPGTVPRQLKLILHGALTKILRPGMSVTVSGIYMPLLDRTFKHPKAKERSDTVLLVHHLRCHRSHFDIDSLGRKASAAEVDELARETPHLYDRMAASIAPAIHGHDDVKKALLLQLVGGSSETFGDGVKIRGDIHILLMGDPGIAKSQLLLRVCAVAPRAHYTCGKGASGVGLTASVVRDPVTNEFSLEGGAIVLADNGVCCIDEFDKMQESDRTAVHEVMEQQTVSISKAGLIATLNARTTILAAANPIFGRYDITKSAVTNIGLPAALLSRFDVVFLLLDENVSPEKDVEMAKYLLQVHKNKRIEHIELGGGESFKPFTHEQIRAIINRAKMYSPKMSVELAEAVTEEYVKMREKDRLQRGSIDENTYTTPRTLFALLRLSQAVARLRFSHTITASDFQEAKRLMEESKRSLLVARKEATEGGVDSSRQKIGELLREMCDLAAQRMRQSRARHLSGTAKYPWVLLKHAFQKAEAMGLDPTLVEEAVEQQVISATMSWDGPQKNKFVSHEHIRMAAIAEDEEA